MTPTSWHPGKMITKERAASVARTLYPDEFTTGEDLRDDPEHPGEPCRFCIAKREACAARVLEVRRAMLVAFGNDPKYADGE